MSGRGWLVQGEPEGAPPTVGSVYEVRDVRKGTFIGRILSVSGEWADVERIEGKIRWLSIENNYLGGNYPDAVSIRASLCELVPQQPPAQAVHE